MERYICIHGHFYQPPRENPWLEAIEIQDSAFPYHDWNERVTSECYAPNSASRILDGERRIMDIVNNYARISFNFGPTVLSWLETYSPEIYKAILDADRLSAKLHSGHGNAIAQVYNHMIMPLANARDKRTQVIWGIKDFQHRFKRFPEGMWISETAVDMETLNILAEQGIKFTILAPHQALRIRGTGTGKWKSVSGGSIDPTRAYLLKLPSGHKLNIFFYDGPISHAVAFEKILERGEDFAHRLLTGFSDHRQWPQILTIATDGETYGHHHRFGDMALSYALNYIESNRFALLTNYGEYLDKFPPTHEVQIIENSSWSCSHGVERWRSDCGCNSGGHPEWNQEWRKHLRVSLDWLRDQLAFRYENSAKKFFKKPWKARDEYIEIILLSRSLENVERFIQNHSGRKLSKDEIIFILKLLESQRHAMLMYTSCGWFFDELSGLETVKVMQYACRAIQLSEDLFGATLENAFISRLAQAKSNVPHHGNGGHIYIKFAKKDMIDLKKVAIHYAISSLAEDYGDETTIYCYSVRKKDYQNFQSGKTSLATGNISVTSRITMESERISFCVLHLYNHAINAGVRTFLGYDHYQTMKDEIGDAFEKDDFIDIIRLMDKHFAMHNYSLRDLFRDERRKILNLLIKGPVEGVVDTYRTIYIKNRILMGSLLEEGVPVPKAFRVAAEVTFDADLQKVLQDENLDVDRFQILISNMRRWKVSVDSENIELLARHKLERLIDKLSTNQSDLALLQRVQEALEIFKLLPVELNYWQSQNIYYKIAKTTFRDVFLPTEAGYEDAHRWVSVFKYIGELLVFNISSILPKVRQLN
ncbi:MAG TPA: glycoside hydrolase [Nitrospiraceae bacterium]|nr:glycoside hydrolase [Nitrospiraceae bacterium]